MSDERDRAADARDRTADERDQVADARDRAAGRRLADAGVGAGQREATRVRTEARVAHPLAAEFVDIARALLQTDTVDVALANVVRAAVRLIDGCDAASISAYVDEVATTLASSGRIAVEADLAQYRSQDGPCLEAIRTLQLVLADDLGDDARWPDFVRTAPDSVRSVMSLPIADRRTAAAPFGSLNSYGLDVEAFDGDDADTAILLTAHLSVLLALFDDAREADGRATQLADAVESRDVIGQAKGILMEREHLTAAQAFDVLRTASQRLNRKLRDVADGLPASGELPTRSAGKRPRDAATVSIDR